METSRVSLVSSSAFALSFLPDTDAISTTPPSDDPDYPYNHLKPSFPIFDTPALVPFEHVDRGLSAPSLGKPKKENTFLKKATGYKFLTPALGVEVSGVDLVSLTDDEKNDL